MKILVFLFLLITHVSVCSQSITVGVLKFAPPFSAVAGDGNHFFGFCIDVMDTICKRLHLECLYKATTVENQLQMLANGKVDLLFAPNPISPALPKEFIFSLPYLASNGQFIALQKTNVANINDIDNKKIGVLHDTLFKSLVYSNFSSGNQIQEYPFVADLISGLAAGEVDVMVINASDARYVVNNSNQSLKLVGGKIPMGEGYGIIALKKNNTLIRRINQSLVDMESDSTYLTLYNNYFGD